MRIRGNRLNDRRTVDLANSFGRPDKPTPHRYSMGTVLVIAVLTGIVGMRIHGGLTPPPPPRHTVTVPGPTVTVVVKVTVDREKPAPAPTQVQVPAVPEDCTAAIQITLNMQNALATITAASSRQTDILSEAHVAILSKDVTGMTKAGNDQRQLENDVSDARRVVNEGMVNLKAALDRCNLILKDKHP